MTTVEVRFRFICKPGTMKFDCFHNISNRLVDITDEDIDPSEEYRQLWSETTRHIIEKSEADCLEYSPRICAYGSPTVNTTQLPLPFLYKPERRMVIIVDPFCGHERCRTQVQQESLQVMSRFRWYNGSQPLDTYPHIFTPVLCYKVCTTVEGVKRCGRCQAVTYCGNQCLPGCRLDTEVEQSSRSSSRGAGEAARERGRFVIWIGRHHRIHL